MTNVPNPVKLSDLEEETSLSITTIQKIVKQADLKPIYDAPYGRGTLRLYDKEAVLKAVEEYKEKKKQEDEARGTKTTEPSKANDELLNAMATELLKNSSKIEEMNETLEKISQQNVIVFKTMEKLSGDLVAFAGNVKTLFTNLETNRDKFQEDMNVHLELILQSVSDLQNVSSKPASQVQSEAKPEITVTEAKENNSQNSKSFDVKPVSAGTSVQQKKEGPKMKVCIVGLLPSQTTLIEKEFGNDFQLKCFVSEKAKGPSFTAWASNANAVLAMTSFMDHSIEDCIRASRGRLVRLDGGLSTLRQKLSTMKAEGLSIQ